MNDHPSSHDTSGDDAKDPGAVNLSRLDPTRDATAFDREIRSIAREAIAERARRRATHSSRWISPRRLSIGLLAVAASLALIVGGIEASRRSHARPSESAMTTASAVVIRRHLAQSDTMIDAFRSAVANKTWDDRLTTRARNLELATRRIQGGRIASDSTLAGLLADLDLVLTEIAGYGDLTAPRGAESELIEYSIRVRSMVPRLGRVGVRPARGHEGRGEIQRLSAGARALGVRVLAAGAGLFTPTVADAATPDGGRTPDSLYRAGREALARRDYHGAADLLARVASQYPSADVAGNAEFWRAYALYASGNATHRLRDLSGAEEALDAQETRYPTASMERQALDLHARVVVAEATLGDVTAKRALGGAEASLAQPLACDDKDLALKLVALEALIDRDQEDAMPTIKRVLATQGPCVEEVRRTTITIVGSTPGMNATEMTEELARAGRALRGWPDPDSVRSPALVGSQAYTARQSAPTVSPADSIPPTRQLGGRIAAALDSFIPNFNIRPLSDGRVILKNYRTHQILLLDSRLAVVKVVIDSAPGGAWGNGAGRGDAAIAPFPGDSTVFMPVGTHAMTLIDPAGRPGRVLPPLHETVTPSMAFHPGAFDAAGRATYIMPPGIRSVGGQAVNSGYVIRPTDILDSEVVVRSSPGRPSLDTVGFLWWVVNHPGVAIRPNGDTVHLGPAGRASVSLINPILAADDAVVLPDGAVAFVRARDYHIDWVDAGGGRRSTPPVPHDWHRLTDDDRVAIVKYVNDSLSANPSFNRYAGSYGSGTRLIGGQSVAPSALADYQAPFSVGATIDMEGRLWIPQPRPLHGVFGSGTIFDIVDQQGRLVDRVQLPPESRPAGFGPGVVFLWMLPSLPTACPRPQPGESLEAPIGCSKPTLATLASYRIH